MTRRLALVPDVGPEILFGETPAATALSVVPLQGQITMPPVRNEPLAIGAMKS